MRPIRPVSEQAGLDLADLDREAVEALIARWLPEAKAKAKPPADDHRFIAMLEAAEAEIAAEDNIPMDNQPYLKSR